MTAYDINYSYDDVPTLNAFAWSNAFMRGVMGPFGSGKSSACAIETVRRGRMQHRGADGVARSRFAVVRNTYGELRDTTIKTFFHWFPPQYFGRYLSGDHTYTIKAFEKTEIEVIFRALDRPDHVRHLLSLELTGAWVNEAREIPWGIIDALQGRVWRYPSMAQGGPTWSGIWLDTNPPDSDSAWYRFFEDRSWLKDFPKLIEAGLLPPGARTEDYAEIFKQPSGLAGNAENLTNLARGRGYYVNLAIGKTPEWCKIYVDGQYGFVVEGKLVYPEYVDAVHCRADVHPVEGSPIIRGWDFGLTPACTFNQILPDGRWLCFDEMTSDNMSIDQFSDEVLEHCAKSFRHSRPIFEDWGDPAGNERAQTDKRTCFEIMRAKDIEVEGSIQDPTMRQEAVRKLLRTPGPGWEPRFVLHERCKMLRKGFLGGYHRRRLQVAGPERYADKPEKNSFSHPHDALQYPVVKYFGAALRGEIDDEDGTPFDRDVVDYAADATRSKVTGY